MAVQLDIHDYERRYASAEAAVQRSELSPRNKELILRYRAACLLKGITGKVRLIRVMGVLMLFGRMVKRDFDVLTRQEIEELLGALLARTPAYSPQTLATYRAILRCFLTWVDDPDDFPTKKHSPRVAWVQVHLRSRDRRKLERGELLTPDEIQALLAVAGNLRDQAFVSTLWESGGRIAEIGNRRLRQVVAHQFGYTLEVTGKTGQRSPLLISSAPYLTAWLTHHPFRHDADAPLWVYNQRTAAPKHIRYQTFRMLLRKLLQRAGIKKRIYPHLFRHSRATYCVANGIFNEQQCKMYFGWAPDSKMLANYSHLTMHDANNALLREHKLTPPTQASEGGMVRHCMICAAINLPTAPACSRCNAVFEERAVRERLATTERATDVVLQLCKVLVDHGLSNEAAAQVHRAGLGDALRSLASAIPPSEQKMPTPRMARAGILVPPSVPTK